MIFVDILRLDIPTRMETERLLLRSYVAGDAHWYYLMSQKNKPHLARYESGNAVMTINSERDTQAVLRGFTAGWKSYTAFFMGAFRKDTRAFAAQIYIGADNWDLPEFELGYFADSEHVGQGYVTEAARAALRFCFEHLGAYRVCLKCDDTNQRSFAVAERCGMIREGHLRENKKRADGSISGTLLYGLLRNEFLAYE